MTDTIKLAYAPTILPTAQHQAGLAGLAVLADVMRRQGKPNTPTVTISEDGGLTLELSREGVAALLDELYDASVEEIEVTSLRKKSGSSEVVPPIETRTRTIRNEKTGKETDKVVYVYPQVIPRAAFLEQLGMPPVWIKLWREAIWATLRGIPKTRVPYEQRSQGKSVAEAESLWKDLGRWQAARQKGKQFTSSVSSALFIGAQSESAERVPFLGSPDQNLLLHFWPVVMGVGEARQITFGDTGPNEETRGFVLSVPLVLDLEAFVDRFGELVSQLDPALAGFRPREAILALPEEGALSYLKHVAELTQTSAMAGDLSRMLGGVEVYHLVKNGNSISLLATGSVAPRPDLVRGYRNITRGYPDLTLRAQLIRNLLSARPWFSGFDRVLSVGRKDLFLGSRFAHGVGNRFRIEFENGQVETQV